MQSTYLFHEEYAELHAEFVQNTMQNAMRNLCESLRNYIFAEPKRNLRIKADFMQSSCRSHADSVPIPCRNHAEFHAESMQNWMQNTMQNTMQNLCEIHAELEFPCRFHAESVPIPKRFMLNSMQNPCRKPYTMLCVIYPKSLRNPSGIWDFKQIIESPCRFQHIPCWIPYRINADGLAYEAGVHVSNIVGLHTESEWHVFCAKARRKLNLGTV